MDRESVVSNNILSIGYDEESQVLEVEFKYCGIYQYIDVPKVIHNNLMAAGSIGKYLHLNVKQVFAHKKV